jgi:hypothetical protein
LATSAIAPTYYVSERVPSSDPMQKSKCITYIAFATRVSANYDRKRSQFECRIPKILEVDDPQLIEHVYSATACRFSTKGPTISDLTAERATGER